MSKTVLITGDWFIDEYWFVTRHHSSMSSHAGQMHYRIYSKEGQPVKDLCGAGLVARVIYEIREKVGTQAEVDIVGLGSWHPLDRDLIAHFIHAKCQTGKNPAEGAAIGSGAVISNTYSLMPCTCNDRVKVTLYNLYDPEHPYWHDRADALPQETRPGVAIRVIRTEQPSWHDRVDALPQETLPGVTIRVIRTYRYDGTRFQQLNRIDWEPENLPEIKPIKPIMESIASKLAANAPPKTLAIVVEDHNRRQFNDAVVNALIDLSAPSREWYVRSKNRATLVQGGSSWIDQLREHKQTIKLLVIGPEISVRGQPSGQLMAGNNKLTRNVFEIIDAIKKQKKVGPCSATGEINLPKIENIVFTSDNLEAVFVFDDRVYTWQPKITLQNIELTRLNWTSALFAAITYELVTLQQQAEGHEKEMLERAIGNANKRCGVRDPLTLPEAHASEKPSPEDKYLVQSRRDWPKIQRDWKDALRGHGIINNKELHVWRAKTDLPKYIACVDGKRTAIRAIWDLLHRFKMSRANARSCSVLIEADPGVGKTHLARMLKDALGFDFIHCDITQMLHRDELLDLFDMVATRQAESDDGLLVFVDEINATLDAAPVYGAFLSPLESGFYMRRGIKFNLKPCIWMFAGTRDEKPAEAKPTEKLADFRSRLSLLQRIDYRSLQLECLQQPVDDENKLSEALITLNKRLQDYTVKDKEQSGSEAQKVIEFLRRETGSLPNGYKLILQNQNSNQLIDLDRQARLEQVYLGAVMINQSFPDVLSVDRFLLQFFYRLDPSRAPARRIGRLVGQLQNVQYGQVSLRNCTTSDWDTALRDTGFFGDERRLDTEFIDLKFA